MFFLWWYWQIEETAKVEEAWKYPSRVIYYSIPLRIRREA